jgi:hypothetical protein
LATYLPDASTLVCHFASRYNGGMNRFNFTNILAWDRIPGWFTANKALAIQVAVKQLPPVRLSLPQGCLTLTPPNGQTLQ